MSNKNIENYPNDTWHTRSVSEVFKTLDTNLSEGLTTDTALARLDKYGPNQLVESGQKNPAKLLWEQISSTMVLILIAAAIVSAFLGKTTETIAISAIVILFTLLGFSQEYRAEKAMAALKKLAVPNVRIRRDDTEQEISAQDLVPGDLVLLETGGLVPADLRLVESVNLRIEEAALTGESEAVEKVSEVINEPEIPLGDRKNMAYMGTEVSYGRGKGVVIATGMQTELGRIATLIQKVDSDQTPLQKQLDQVGKQLALAGVIVAALVLVIGVLSGETITEMFLTAISVAVAVVPEGLPAVVTVTLALGAQRMLKRQALIRKLPAVETLGSVTVICSDKTGTLTENRMTVTVIDIAGHQLDLEGTRGNLPNKNSSINLLENQPPGISFVLTAGALCNDASLAPDPKTGRYISLGDPTEGALLVAAAQTGLDLKQLENALPRVAELPFDSDRKRMTTIHGLPREEPTLPASITLLSFIETPYIALTKGSVDGLLDLATSLWVNQHQEQLTDQWRNRILAANEEMATDGKRVLGLAFKPIDRIPDNLETDLENDLVFIGMVGMIDPPRPEVRAAVSTANSAGIRPIMITGDHPLTARFIAYDLGISNNGRVKTGLDLDRMDSTEFQDIVEEVSIYARVSPEHKLRIVEALQQNGQVVAMAGDGVNDSPALKKADIGIAMGITGTDVAKEASDMVLINDNFATIVSAVEEGRVIYDNIRRFVKFSIAGNIGKVGVMLFAPLLGITVALLPLQLLWLNLLTDGLLGLGLGLEPAEPNTMKIPPRNPKASLFSGGLTRHVTWVGIFIGAVALLAGYLYFDPSNPEEKTWQTMIFTTLAFLQIGQAIASRSATESVFKLGIFSNPTLIILAVLTFVLQLVAVYTPFLEKFFGVVPLTINELLVTIGLGSLSFIAIEFEKLIIRRFQHSNTTS